MDPLYDIILQEIIKRKRIIIPIVILRGVKFW